MKLTKKNYVFNLETIFLKFKSIRTLVRNWESETNINFDIFFEVLQEKTNTLLKIIQTQIDFIRSYTQTQFLEIREIIKNDFTNLVNCIVFKNNTIFLIQFLINISSKEKK